ncbi:TetR/AcrR family transcriptional regulator [Sphaerisporangium fuscum]|uniref:TetR/AcrR family transcriptional regulator n=1 Tax=Sphaerisporangium fuscum TaxID=2835868 RepID=UPI001BDC0887|nr:TetR/AcrR family transcriptional regulator [Sphaerisporangium fuscum]
MSEPRPRVSRAEQRRNTEARILAEAKRLFADTGYEQTTIRAVATAAGVNAGLVMHYFGSKEELFLRATARTSADEPAGGTPAELTEQLLSTLAASLAEEPVASLAVMRSMLTHPGASRAAAENAARYSESLREAIPGDDAGVRAATISAIMIGLVVSRHLLKFDDLRDAPPEQIVELLRPCLRSLTRADG